jgi:hypothetical protein
MPQDAGVLLLSHPESGTIQQSERAILLQEVLTPEQILREQLNQWRAVERQAKRQICAIEKALCAVCK